MSNRPIQPPQQDETTNSTSPTIDRRGLLQGSGVAAMLAVAGCLDTLEGDSSDETDNPDDDIEAVIDTYFEAAVEDDTETISEIAHDLYPFDPEEWAEEGWEFQGGDEDELPPYEITVETSDGSPEDVLEIESAEFWFQDVDLEAEFEDESIAVADVTSEEVDGEFSRWALVSEGDDWKLLIHGPEDDTPDDPEEAFEDEIEDEDDDVVEYIDWEYEDDETADDDADDAFDVTQAEVMLTDSPGFEAHTVRAESTIEGGEMSVYDPDEEPGGWANSWMYVTFDPDGDEIVVTAISGDDDEETIVHREHYLP